MKITKMFEIEKWKRLVWEKGSRGYSAELKKDLFGSWVVIRNWGSIGSPRGKTLCCIACDYEEGLIHLGKVAERRKKRGYVQTFPQDQIPIINSNPIRNFQPRIKLPENRKNTIITHQHHSV